MADNKTVINNSGNVGTDIPVATDEIGGVNYQRVKLTHGVDGVAVDASGTNPLPITGALSVTGTMVVDSSHAEDAASANGDTGTAVLSVRQDTLASSTSTDGDYAFLKTNSNGELYVVTSGAISLTGTLPTTQVSGIMTDGGVDATVKYAAIDAASSGNNTLVAAVTSKKIRILAASMVASAAVNVRFQSGAGGTSLSGLMNLAANGGFVLPYNPQGWNETAASTLLNLNLSAAVSVGGMLTYVEIT